MHFVIDYKKKEWFTKAKLKKLDDQTNIDKNRVAANISEYLFLFLSEKDVVFLTNLSTMIL